VRLAAATAGWIRLIGEFDAREGWGGYGLRSCAHWLSWQCGLSPNAAREHVRVARALRNLPVIAAAFDEGRLPYAKVRALTRVAEPAIEADLLEFAIEATASQLDRTVREWRRSDDYEKDHPDLEDDEDCREPVRPDPEQEFRYWWDEEGMLVVHARLSVDNGAPFLAGLTSVVERAARRDRAAAKSAARDAATRAAEPPAAGAAPGPGAPDGAGAGCGDAADRPEPVVSPSCDADEENDLVAAREATTARRCAALAALAALAGAAAEADRRAGDPPRREVIVHVDAAVLAEDAAAGRAYVEGGPPLTPAQARRLLCEATVIAMLEAGREVLAHGRARRLASRAQRRALLRRDGGCARPGCGETRLERLHAHHLRHWLFGGRTDLPNLVLLCDTDHGLAHDLDLIMARRDGRLIVTTPDGRRIWGPADAALTTGLHGLDQCAVSRAATGSANDDADVTFIGVHPIDTARGRRPVTHPTPRTAGRARRAGTTRKATVSTLLFPHGEPPLPDAMHVNGERMSIAYAVSVLIGHRDFVRRMAAETGTTMAA